MIDNFKKEETCRNCGKELNEANGLQHKWHFCKDSCRRAWFKAQKANEKTNKK